MARPRRSSTRQSSVTILSSDSDDDTKPSRTASGSPSTAPTSVRGSESTAIGSKKGTGAARARAIKAEDYDDGADADGMDVDEDHSGAATPRSASLPALVDHK